MLKKTLAMLALSSLSLVAAAEEVPYKIDSSHTFPSFEADHMGGLSVWRGKFNETEGKVLFDKKAKTGSVEIHIKTDSIDFGFDKMNAHAKKDDIFNVAKYPLAIYKGKLAGFNGEAPTEVQGELTLHGVTKPVNLKLNSFKCIQHPMLKREVCGADAEASFNRADFGIDYGVKYGFDMNVKLRIQVEAMVDVDATKE